MKTIRLAMNPGRVRWLRGSLLAAGTLLATSGFAAPRDPCAQELPVTRTVTGTCLDKVGFREYTNVEPCRVSLFLTELILPTNSTRWASTNAVQAGESHESFGFGNWDRYWGAGQASEVCDYTYHATKTTQMDWQTLSITEGYSGSYSNYYWSIYTSAFTNDYVNGATGHRSHAAYTNAATLSLDTGTLSNEGWVSTTYIEVDGYIYEYWSINPNLWYTNTSGFTTNGYSSTNYASVQQYGDLEYLSPSNKVYVFEPPPTGGERGTRHVLTNEYTTLMLKEHALADLGNYAYGTTGKPGCEVQSSAGVHLKNCETNLDLAKLEIQFTYSTETNKTYLITRVFNVTRNGSFDSAITISNLVSGTGTSTTETNRLAPVLVNNFVWFQLEGHGPVPELLACETMVNQACCTNCADCTISTEINIDSVTISPYAGGCAGENGCNGGPGGPGLAFDGRAGFRFSLGNTVYGQPVGELNVAAEVATNTLTQPGTLNPLVLRDKVTLVTDGSGAVRQVGSSQCLADVVPVSSGYQVVFYATNAFLPGYGGGLIPTNGLTPFVTWTIRDSGGAGAAPSLIEGRGALQITNSYQWLGEARSWSVTSGNGSQKEKNTASYDPGSTNRMETRQVLNPTNDTVVWQKVSRFTGWPWGERLVEEVEGLGAEARTNSYFYMSNAPLQGRLQTMLRHDGYWERYTYDDQGKLTSLESPLLNSDADTGGRTVYYDYSPQTAYGDDGSIQPLRPRVETPNNPNRKSYFLFSPNTLIEVRCRDANGGPFGSPPSLATTNRYYPAGDPHATKLKSVEHPDGTMDIFAYGSDPQNFTNTVWSGLPNQNHTAIVDGTRTVTVLGGVGEVLLKQGFDVAPGRADILVSQESYSYLDTLRRSHTVTYLDGTSITFQYGCCGLESVTDRDGVQVSYVYDQLKRLQSELRFVNGPSQPAVTTSYFFDSAGRPAATTRTGTNGPAITLSGASYDSLGRVRYQTNALNGLTSTGYGFDGEGRATVTTTLPNTGTRVETRNRDGSLYELSGTAAHGVRYGYYQGAAGWRTEAYVLDANGDETGEWSATETDSLERPLTEEAAGSTVRTEHYDDAGRLYKRTDADDGMTLFGFDGRGQQDTVAVRVNASSSDAIDFGGSDRVTRTVLDVVYAAVAGTNVVRTQVYAWSQDGVNASNLVSLAMSTVDGLRTWSVVLDIAKAATNRTVRSYAAGGYRNEYQYAPDSSYVYSRSRYGRLEYTEHRDSGGALLEKTQYAYDAHGRVRSTSDLRNGATAYGYNNADLVSSVTSPAPTSLLPAQTTLTFHNTMLQPTNTVLPDNTSVFSEFALPGELSRTWGSRAFPVEYTYGPAGRVESMRTWQDATNAATAAVTTWEYNTRGLLAGKEHADGFGPGYTYTAGGRLWQRSWARESAPGAQDRLQTTYEYTRAGDLRQVSYSDQMTPAVSFGYDRRGRLNTVTNGNQRCALDYNSPGALLSEAWAGDILDGLSLTNGYDHLLRRTNVVALHGGTVLNWAEYGFDQASRLSVVSQPSSLNPLQISASYSYVANSPLVSQIVFKTNASVRMTTSKSYDYLNRLTSIRSANAQASTLSSFDYQYNQANQRVRSTLADGSYWVYEFDSLGQVSSGKRYWADGVPAAGQQFEYAHDDIGNRKKTWAGGDQNGANLHYASYSANNLNQYSSRSVTGAVDVVGVALATNSVVVNGQAPYRKGEYFWKLLTADNAADPVWLEVWATSPNQASITGHVFFAETPEQFGYDSDGNLTSDGRWTYTWDAENRLVRMVARTVAGPQQRIDFQYDWQGRRIAKTVWNNTEGTGNPALEQRFIYDGWNLLATLNPQLSPINTFLWGLDLSGSLQGAGGVGGLVAVWDSSTISNLSSVHFPCFDGNGNVVALVSPQISTMPAVYEYGPFGEVVRATGPMAKANPFRFSTKYLDDETDLLYYGYRYYIAGIGRWLSRDPVEESGGLNVYGFVANSPLVRWDALGLRDDNALVYNWKKSQVIVSKCEVVILFGHGSEADHWNWKMAHGCNAAGAVMCWPGANSAGIPEDKDLNKDRPERDRTILWGPYTPGPVNSDEPNVPQMKGNPLADPMFDKVYDNTARRVQELCKQKCCHSIRVRFLWKPKSTRNDIIANPKNSQTDYQGSRRIQDYRVDCATRVKTYISR